MHYYDVHEALLKKCEIHGTLGKVFRSSGGANTAYNETYLILQIFFSTSTEGGNKLNMNLMRGYDIHEILYLNSEIMIHG